MAKQVRMLAVQRDPVRLSSGFPVVRVPMKMHDREDVNTIGLYVV
jgi:hypothetical protein